MAKYLDKDPEVYARERDGFLRDLKHFHETRGTPFRRAPKLSGHPIDLYLLYSLVTGRGGWIKVNYRNQWSELFEALEIPTCVNASIALKQIYLRYLDRWEKVHYLGEEADRGSDDDEESRHKRWSARALHSVPLSYNYNQHCLTEITREYNNLSTNIYKKSDYDRLALSLISPLPNEQDFAINVCTLLSNDGKHTLKLEKHPRILDYLLAHAGVFNHGSLRRLFMHSYITVRKQAIHNFWQDAISNEEYLDLTVEPNSNSTFSTSKNHLSNCPNITAGTSCKSISTSRKNSKDFNDNTNLKRTHSDNSNSDTTKNNSSLSSRLSAPASSVNSVKTSSFRDSGQLSVDESMVIDDDDDGDQDIFAPHNDEPDCAAAIQADIADGFAETTADYAELRKKKWERSATDRTLFNLGRNLGTRDYMGQRVLQIATILRNLSFIEENIPVLSTNRSFLRFMLLCTASRWNQLQNLGLDMLGNIANDILVCDFYTDRLPAVLLKLVCDGLQTEDRHWCISALEVLNKLSQNAKNEDTLLRVLEPEVYKRVCSFLTIHDVMLLIYTLECLYSLSSLGERSCNLIVSNVGVVDTLVSLVTVEGKSYGPKACIGMKLVETVAGATQQTTSQPGSSQQLTSPVSQPQSPTLNAASVTTASSSVGASASPSPPLHTISAPSATPVSISGVTTGPGGSTYSSGKATATTLGAVIVTTTPAKSSTKVITNQQSIASPSPITPKPPLKSSTPTFSPTSTQQQQPSTAGAGGNPIITAQQLVQQQHAHQQAIQENEQFALTWLRTTYEPCAIVGNARVESQELYRHYVASCQKIGRKGMIAPLHFPRCVRSVFGGTVGPNQAKPPGSSDATYYDGIKVRDKPLLIPQTSQQSATTPQKNTQASSKPTTTTTTPTNKGNSKANKAANNNSTAKAAASSVVSTTSSAVSNTPNSQQQSQQLSPASPILKAQLSAPPKQQQRDSANISPTNQIASPAADKSQVKSHPHLSQALLASTSSTSSSTTTLTNATTSAATSSAAAAAEAAAASGGQQGNNTSLIKSLLATKVNNNVSMQAVSEPQLTVSSQVAARQRLLAQQTQTQTQTQTQQSLDETKLSHKQSSISLKRATPTSNPRLNGARQLFPSTTETPDSQQQSSAITSSSSATTTSLQHTMVSSSRREPPQPPPPPLVALVANNHAIGKRTELVVQSEDSDSMGNNSMASSTGPAGIGCVSSTEDGENSLASFDGLINGIPSVEQHDTIMLLNDSDDSDDTDDTTTGRSHVVIKKPLMLADLLEKKVDRDPPIINGILSKELRIGDKGLQLVENHIDKVLGSLDPSSDSPSPIIDQVDGASDDKLDPPKTSKKRPAEDQQSIEAQQPKKLQRIAIITQQSPPLIDNSSNSNDNDDLNSGTVSTAAAKLFADFAADILEDEDNDDENDVVIPPAPRTGTNRQQQEQEDLSSGSAKTVIPQAAQRQQQQIIVSQPSSAQMLPSGTQLKTQLGQTVIVQNTQQVVSRQAQQQQQPQQQVIVQQASAGQILLSQGSAGQMQLVATGQSGGQPTQYVIQTTSGTGAQNFVVAQPQTAVVHGQQQTVLVAQTAQQVGGQGGKTIIILQPTQVQQMQHQMQQQQVQQHVQKVVMGPHGQQMVVTTPVTRSSTITTTQGTITLSAAPQNTSNIATTQMLPQTNNNIQVVQTPPKPLQTATNTSNDCSSIAQQAKAVALNKQTNNVVSLQASAVVTSSQVTTTSTSLVTATSTAVKSAPIKKKAVVQVAGKEALFLCEWANCRVETAFKSANQVFMHVCEEHCKETSSSATDELLCQWDRCDNMKRKRFSLMTHLQDKHCNLESMKASLIKRKQALHSGKSEPASQSPPSQQHPGYAPDAAFHAIKRHALEFVNPKELQQQQRNTNGSISVVTSATTTTTPAITSGVVVNNQNKASVNAATVILPRAMQASITDQDDNEGPVTKSIRLTASLILRNLVIYSTNCRRFLKPYEPHLANVALSNVESSRTIAQVLYDMNDSPHHHHHHTSSSNSR